jgi:c-di-GMP-binding flagellar brake protein YcgR
MKELPARPLLACIDKAQIPVGVSLGRSLLDPEGRILVRAGTTVRNDEHRDFLFENFQLCICAVEDEPASTERGTGERHPAGPFTLADLGLSIGSPLGVRGQLGISAATCRSQVIGFSPNHALFITPPLAGREPIALAVGKNVEIVAIGSQAIFRFVCTVESVRHVPFDYVVLSSPSAIRRLRERKGVRVHTRLAVAYHSNLHGAAFEGWGIGRDLSVNGMSLLTSEMLGDVGAKVSVTFPIVTEDLDIEFEATAWVRHANVASGPGGLVTHGLEFDALGADQQVALRSLVFSRLHAGHF